MIDLSMLSRWSESPEQGGRYLRPLVCRGQARRKGAFIIGINPATEIGPADICFEEYLPLLLDLEAFASFYGDLRVKRQKPRESPTRTGINGIAKWLGSLGWDFVADTNVSPYPTTSAEELINIPLDLQSRWVFWEVLSVLSPALAVLHGKDSLHGFAAIVPEMKQYTKIRFSELVRSPHLRKAVLPNGEATEVYVCPHLRFFGNAGGKKFVCLKRALTTGSCPDA